MKLHCARFLTCSTLKLQLFQHLNRTDSWECCFMLFWEEMKLFRKIKAPWVWTKLSLNELNEENERNKKCGNIFDRMPLEILEKIFFYALAKFNNTFPGHICCTFQNSVAAIPRINALREKTIGCLPRLYVNDHTVFFPKYKRVPREIHVNVKQISWFWGVHNGVIMEIRRIIKNSQWYCAWLVSWAEAYDWCIVTNIYLEKRK